MRRSIKAGMLVAPTAVALTVAFIAQVATGEQVSGSTADICRWSAPCKAGETYGHPGDCAAYYSCDSVSSSFIAHQCPGDQKFDRENGACVDPVIARCTVSCPDTVAPVVVSDVTSVVETEDAGRNATTMGAPKTKPSTTTTTTTTTTTPQPTTITPPTTTTTPTTTPRITTKRTTTSTTTPTTTTKRTTTSSTTTTTTTTSTTTVPPSTTRRTSTPLVIHVGDTGKEAKPGYVAVSTLSPPTNTSGAGTAGKGMSAGTIGVIAGTVGGVVVILVVLIVLLIILLRRRKRKKRQRIPKIDNPHYRNAQPQSYRFSRDSTLYVGNTVNLQTTNNNAAIGSKKNDTSPDGSLSKQKRKAPPPPNPFGTDGDYLKVNNHALTDIYEKDSHASSENIELGTFSARNYQASSDAIADDDDDDHRTGPSAPLIDKHADASESAHSESDSGAGSDEENESSSGSESARSSNECGSASEDADEASQTSDKMPLAKSVDSAGRSLDEYDKTRNPFVIS